MYIEGLVLAGGASRRMGQNKLVLPVSPTASTTVVRHVIDTVAGAADHVSVLVPPADAGGARTLTEDKFTESDLRQIRLISDASSYDGPLSAMASAWPVMPEDGAVLVVAGDLPGLTTEVLTACINRYHDLRKSLRQDPQSSLGSYELASGSASDIRCSTDSSFHELSVDGVLVEREHVMQPLLGCYRPGVGHLLKSAAANGERRLMRAVSQLSLDFIAAEVRGWPDWWTRPVHTPQEYRSWLERDMAE